TTTSIEILVRLRLILLQYGGRGEPDSKLRRPGSRGGTGSTRRAPRDARRKLGRTAARASPLPRSHTRRNRTRLCQARLLAKTRRSRRRRTRLRLEALATAALPRSLLLLHVPQLTLVVHRPLGWRNRRVPRSSVLRKRIEGAGR